MLRCILSSKFSKSRQKVPSKAKFVFLGGMGQNHLFSGPPKGTSLRGTTSFDVLNVKISARVSAVESCQILKNK